MQTKVETVWESRNQVTGTTRYHNRFTATTFLGEQETEIEWVRTREDYTDNHPDHLKRYRWTPVPDDIHTMRFSIPNNAIAALYEASNMGPYDY